MRMFKWIFGSSILIFTIAMDASSQKLDVQGHRGARGLLPENTIPAFIKALDLGVTTVELDLAITADSMVVVSHEPYFSSYICLTPEGEEIAKNQAESHNIYKMTYEEVARYDCGSKGNKRFEEQETLKISKPLLIDVIKEVEHHVKGNTHFEVDYNIEIKSGPGGDNIFHPEPKEFSDIVYSTIDQYLPWDRVIIQSFDFRVLQYWNEKYPDVRLAALIESPGSPASKIKKLGFEPDIYSPYFKFLNKSAIKYLHEKDIKVIPWTVNDKEEMGKMVKMGVDGIITDYPNRAAELGLTLKLEEK